MVYNLTEKLKFDDDPKLVIGDVELTVRSDAETVLKLLDIMQTKGEATGAAEALEILLSAADRKKLAGLHLKLVDWRTVVNTAISLAMGRDPDEDETAGE